MAAGFVAEERKPHESELKYFRANPGVGGMATEDGRVIINPFSPLNDVERDAVRMNETARLFMRRHGGPGFALTDAQRRALAGTAYEGADPRLQAETIAARLFSGDPSGGTATREQKFFVNQMRKRIAPPKSESLRPDGTKKGLGWLGPLKRPDGRMSTEITFDVHLDGKKVYMPLMVPTLTKQELDAILQLDEKDPDFFKKLPPGVEDKAVEHAIQRLRQGLSPFKD